MKSPIPGSVSLVPSWRPNPLLLATTLFVASAAATVLGIGALQPKEPLDLALTESQVKRFTKIQIDLRHEDDPDGLRAQDTPISTGNQRPSAPVAKRAAKAYALRNSDNYHKLEVARSMAAHSGIVGILKASEPGIVTEADGYLGVAGFGPGGGGGGGGGMAFASSGIIRLNGLVSAPLVQMDTSKYEHPTDHGSIEVSRSPVSTFSMDVDTGSYSNARGYIEHGQLPPRASVRLEEFVNYFPYDYPRPQGEHPFGVSTELARCPWNSNKYLLRIGVRAVEVREAQMPPANLVFLIDVSGSMNSDDRLPLLQRSLRLLVDRLRAEDRVSIVVYAGREQVMLEPTRGSDRTRIMSVIDHLEAAGITAGEAGIRTAYRLARSAYIPGGINRILLATDGDFNVGISDTKQLLDLIEKERKSGVSLSTLGFGRGNFNDHMMERLADAGNGNYSFIDSLAEGRKVLAQQASSTLHTVAKDVKVQVEFNPTHLREYRLLGYENRALHREDFKNDHVDAGEVGAGTTVTALYELTPSGAPSSAEPLRYVQDKIEQAIGTRFESELAFLRIRYKSPSGETSKLLEIPIAKPAMVRSFDRASDDLRFASAVAGFAQLLRQSDDIGKLSFRDVRTIAAESRGQDEFGYRRDFVKLVDEAAALRIETEQTE